MRFPSLTLHRGAAARRAAVALAGTAALAGCSFITGIPNVSRVVVTVSPRTIVVNGTATAFGTAYNGDTPIRNANRAVNFSSTNTKVAQVNPTSGQIIGVAPGAALIEGSSGGKKGSDSIYVIIVPAKQVLIQARTPRFRVGALNALNATVLDSASNRLDDRTVTWTSRTPSVVAVTVNGGIVTPAAVGTSWIVASVDNGGTSGTVVDSVLATVTLPPVSGVQVTPTGTSIAPGQKQPFSVAVVDSLNATVTGRTVRWSSSNPNVATVDPNTGVATGAAPGSTVITATVDRVPGSAVEGTAANGVQLAVTPPLAATTTVDRSSVSLRVGASTLVAVSVRDAYGAQIVGRAIRATGFDPNVVQVTFNNDYSQATITARAAGNTSVVFQGRDVTTQQDQGTPSTVTVTVSP